MSAEMPSPFEFLRLFAARGVYKLGYRLVRIAMALAGPGRQW